MGISYPVHSTKFPILTSWNDTYACIVIMIVHINRYQFLHEDYLLVKWSANSYMKSI